MPRILLRQSSAVPSSPTPATSPGAGPSILVTVIFFFLIEILADFFLLLFYSKKVYNVLTWPTWRDVKIVGTLLRFIWHDLQIVDWSQGNLEGMWA